MTVKIKQITTRAAATKAGLRKGVVVKPRSYLLRRADVPRGSRTPMAFEVCHVSEGPYKVVKVADNGDVTVDALTGNRQTVLPAGFLRVVKQPVVKLNGNYLAHVSLKGTQIKVGCQTIKAKQVFELAAVLRKAQRNASR